ncbi:Abi-alpha family protein [Roseateles sp. P5_E4]
MSDENVESAKAVQEVAKTAGQALKVMEKSGGFIAKHIDAPIEHAMEMLADHLKFTRAVRQARLFKRFQEELHSLGPDVRPKPLPLGFAVDAIEQGSIEEVDELQDLWARLLANAADADKDVEPRRAYVSMLKDFTPLDARIFQMIYGLTPSLGQFIFTGDLPDGASTGAEDNAATRREPPDAVKSSLSNLVRLGLLNFAQTVKGDELHAIVLQTFAGRDLMRALSRRRC